MNKHNDFIWGEREGNYWGIRWCLVPKDFHILTDEVLLEIVFQFMGWDTGYKPCHPHVEGKAWKCCGNTLWKNGTIKRKGSRVLYKQYWVIDI